MTSVVAGTHGGCRAPDGRAIDVPMAYLNASASAIAEPAAREKEHEGHQQQQPEQRAYTDTARNAAITRTIKINSTSPMEPSFALSLSLFCYPAGAQRII